MGQGRVRDSGDNYSGSSEHLKKKLNIGKTIDTRLKVLMAIMVALAGLLIARLYQIQIVQADHFMSLYEKHQTPPVYSMTKRGEMVARNGEGLVLSKPNRTITYIKQPKTSDEKMWEMAERFSEYFNTENDLNEYDSKILWLRQNKNGSSLLTDEDRARYKDEKTSQSDIDKEKMERITEEMLASIPESDKKTFSVLLKMEKEIMGQAAIVYEHATNEQIAYISENEILFDGFSYTTQWEREYNEKVDLQYLYGGIGDIPAHKVDSMKSKGYSLDDKVGTSGLEYQYEEILSGIDSQYTKNSNNALELSKEGVKGKTLKTTLDLELQQFVEEDLKKELESHKNDPRRSTFNQMHMVVSDPRTGDILAIAAMVRNSKGEYVNDVERTMLSTGTYPVGSVVKPATVYMSLDQGVTTPDERITDVPMHIAGTPERASWRAGLGSLNAQDALMKSSNVYMYMMAVRLGESTYIPNGPLVFPHPDETYDMMRNYFSMFGLGTLTQVDFPREEVGYKGNKTNSGSILDFVVGQFDNYNALQLNQYVSALANGGYRMKPRFVSEAIDPDTNKTVFVNEPTVLNTIENKDALEQSRLGMKACAMQGWCYANTRAPFDSAAKSGTAQAYTASGQYVRNSTYLAFAPYDEPKIAISCIAPEAYFDEHRSIQNSCGFSATRVLDWYMSEPRQ